MSAKAPGIFGWCFVLAASSAIGCAGLHDTPCTAGESAADAQRIWQSHHPSDYQFVWQQTCFCLPEAVQPIRVTVRYGAIASATDPNGVPIGDTVRQNLLTIDALYERVLAAEGAGAKVRFECAGDGIPKQVYIDPNPGVADDEFRVTITAFTTDVAAPAASNIH